MQFHGTFAGDIEFSKLVGHQNDVDVTRAALEIARDSHPSLDFEPTLAALEDIADRLRSSVTRMRSDVDALEKMCDTLRDQYDFRGDATCFDRAESSYLNYVVETGRGIPISLSLVYVAVGERLGLPITGVATPAHFLCRFDGVAGPLYIDAFRQGRILDPEECVDWICGVSGMNTESVEASLEPASAKAIITRMLNNLKALHLKQSNWPAADRVLQRLLALRPGSYVDRRDLASVSLMLHRPGRVITLLEGQLGHVCDEEREAAEELLSAARRLIAALN